MSTTVLLGPQRFRPTAGAALAEVAPEGRVATVTAGWRDREMEDAELDALLGGRSHNLNLFHRFGEVLRHDRTFRRAGTAYNRATEEASSLYRLRLGHALDAVYATLRREARPDLVDAALRAGLQSVRDIDSWYLWLVHELEQELRADGGMDTSDVIGHHRGEIEQILAGAGALTIAGGHVGLLRWCLRLFAITPSPQLPVLGWSAGAMVLTDHIVLYNDKGPAGVQPAELWDRGLGRAPGIIVMPHARRRIHLEDTDRNRVLAHRFHPTRIVLLDDGARLPVGVDGTLPDDAKVLTLDGTISTLAAERRTDPDGPHR